MLMNMNVKQFNLKKVFSIKYLVLFLLISCTVLSGCSNRPGWMRNRSNDYKTAKDSPSLKIPEGMSLDTFSDTYDVPMD